MQLRERVKDVIRAPLDTDIMLYKYLKARDFKIEVAEALYRKSIEYRKNEGVDTILDDYEPTLVPCLNPFKSSNGLCTPVSLGQ